MSAVLEELAQMEGWLTKGRLQGPVPNCLFFNIVERGGGQTHVKKVMLQILYNSGGFENLS